MAQPRRIDNQRSSQSSMSQRMSEPKPLEDGKGEVDVVSPAKETLSPPQRLASGNDDVIFISEDAASEMSDASDDETRDESLPSVQAIMQSVAEERGTMDCPSTVACNLLLI